MIGRSAALAALVLLSVPVSAQAVTTFVVDPSGPVGCDSAHTCNSVSAANDAVADGDRVVIHAGTYKEAGPIAVTKQNVTFSATPGTVNITNGNGHQGDPVFTLASGTTLDGLIVAVSQNGGSAVTVLGAGTTIKNSSLTRLQGEDVDAPVYQIADDVTAGSQSIEKSFVLQAPSSSIQSDRPAAAVVGGKTSTLNISDSTIISGPTLGQAVVLPGNDVASGSPVPNTLTRVQLITQNPNIEPLRVVSPAGSASPKLTRVDSSIIGGQGGGGAVSGIVASAEASGTSSSGPVTVEGAHVTIAGVRQPAYAESQSGLLSGAGGTATIDLDRSIVHGTAPSKVVRVTTGGLGGPPSSASITIRRSDTTDTTGGDVTVTDSQNTQDAFLFADPTKYDYHLRFGSPAIDKGGDQVPGESTTDIDGQPRGAKTDLGADEFINQPPVAKVAASAVSVRQGDPVTFDASASRDPDIGGGIARYLWDFGDGTTASTTTPSVQHTYAAVGNYTVTMVALDAANAAGSATTAVNVTDGTPPEVKIASPKDSQRFHIYTTTTTTKKVKDKATGKTKRVRVKHRGRRAIRLRGTASDASGLASVELSLRRVSISRSATSTKKKSSSKTKKGSSSTRAKAAASKCVYLDPKNQKFVLRTCSRPKFFVVHQDKGLWSYKISDRLNIKPGLYELQARATDKAGVVSDPVVVRFRLL